MLLPNLDRSAAVGLLRGLVAIPSLSGNEEPASHWLVAQMAQFGYTRAYVDAVGNAVGEIGDPDAESVIILLGHIDTVPGNIPVRIAIQGEDEVLYGRGAVDAKGPLAAFVAAGARLAYGWAVQSGVRLVVVGAVEEEAATSKGARYIAAQFDGKSNPRPVGCVIGEPSSWQRVTLGYKGRLLVELDGRQPMAHSAGPSRGVASAVVDLWNWITAYAERYNQESERAFDQVLPSLRSVNTGTDETMHDRVSAVVGIRLPPMFDAQTFARQLLQNATQLVDGEMSGDGNLDLFAGEAIELKGTPLTLNVRFRGYEPAWRSGRSSELVRSFLRAIRTVDPGARPSFVVKTGTSDMNVVGPLWGCPIVAYGPGDSSYDHTPDEQINLDEYWQAILVLEEMLRALASEPANPG